MNQRRKPREKVMIQVYALVFGQGLDQVYVGQCRDLPRHIRQVYRLHINGQYTTTKRPMEEALKTRKLPVMYALTKYEGYSGKSLSHVYAYARYFHEKNAVIFLPENCTEYITDLSENSRQIFDRIKDIPIAEMLSEDHILVKDYRLKEWDADPNKTAKKDTDKVYLSVYTTHKDAARIRERAAECGMSVSEYGVQMMLNGAVVQTDNHALADVYRAEVDLMEAVYKLKDSIKQFDGMYKAHEKELANIEADVHELTETVKKMAHDSVAAARVEAGRSARRAVKRGL